MRLIGGNISDSGIKRVSDGSAFNVGGATTHEVTIKAWGAGGGSQAGTPDPNGGGGGFAQATITVPEDQCLCIVVGKAGAGMDGG